jgi:hypothetical protein
MTYQQYERSDLNSQNRSSELSDDYSGRPEGYRKIFLPLGPQAGTASEQVHDGSMVGEYAVFRPRLLKDCGSSQKAE